MRPSQGWGFGLCLGVVGKFEPEPEPGKPKSLTAIKHVFGRDRIN